MPLAAALARRFPASNPSAEKLLSEATRLCTDMVSTGLLDKTAHGRLCSSDDNQFWPIFSEALVADRLFKANLTPQHREPGPDFLLELDGRRHWIEVITPQPNGIPDDWVKRGIKDEGAFHYPAEEILLRWTAAIKEKAEKLLGVPGNAARPGYIASGIVGPEDVYVIAVNGLRLRMGAATGIDFPQLEGISQFPVAVEATYSVGPYAITVNRTTLEQTGAGHKHRKEIERTNRPPVPADTFHDPRFAPISAVWALDLGPTAFVDQEQPMAVVHNPNARNRLSQGLLPAQHEYRLRPSESGFAVVKEQGRGWPRKFQLLSV
ncbi:MAG: hypothetical protein ACK4PN_15150 [Allorhizobium sp.]